MQAIEMVATQVTSINMNFILCVYVVISSFFTNLLTLHVTSLSPRNIKFSLSGFISSKHVALYKPYYCI